MLGPLKAKKNLIDQNRINDAIPKPSFQSLEPVPLYCIFTLLKSPFVVYDSLMNTYINIYRGTNTTVKFRFYNCSMNMKPSVQCAVYTDLYNFIS